MTRVSWSGSLDNPVLPRPGDAPSEQLRDDDPNPLLTKALQDARAGRSRGYELLPLFFAARVWVETESAKYDTENGVRVRSVPDQSVSWLPVFTSLTRLAVFAQLTGRGQDELSYAELPGREIERDVLPGLPARTGVVLDPGQEHVFALPPAGTEED